MLVVKQQSPIATLLVMNRSTEPQEVTVDLRFGYSVMDSAGQRTMLYGDTIAGAAFSAVPFTRVFPRQFVLEPGQEQSVRFVIAPPADLPDGVYWTRISTSSVPRVPLVVEETPRVLIRVEHVTSLLYHRGSVSTGLQIGELDVRTDSTQLQLRVPVRRTGNGPFLGEFTFRIVNEAGEVIDTSTVLDGVYFDLVHTHTLERARLPAGRYRVEFTARPRRPDVAPEDAIPGSNATRTFVLDIR